MRKYVYVFCLALLLLIAGCSKDEQLPSERLNSYIDLWKSYNFTEMYGMLLDEVSETYTTEDFTERYEKVYQDLEIENLKLSYDELTEDEQKEALENGVATFTLHAEMDSMAGPIQFSENIQLHLQKNEQDEELEEWYVEWNPN